MVVDGRTPTVAQGALRLTYLIAAGLANRLSARSGRRMV